MCKESNKLRLCTCKLDTNKLKNYWVFYRFAKDKDNMVIGETMMPVAINIEDELHNRELLPKLLNEGNVFDVELHPKNKDRLQLSFFVTRNNEGRDTIDYGFEYKKGKWVQKEFDWLMWAGNHDEEQNGKITNALMK